MFIGPWRRDVGCRRSFLSGAVAILLTILATTVCADAQTPVPWLFFGGDLTNSRANLSPNVNIGSPVQINPRTAPKLTLKWSYSTVGDISATPTVEPGGLYFPDYAGNLYKLDPQTGALIWTFPLSTYVGGSAASSRSSPAIGAMGEIVLGIGNASSSGARVVSVNRTTGAPIWTTVVDPNTHSYVTSSPVIYNKRVYVGVASSEEVLVASTPGFVPSFRGSVVALDEATGAIVWQFKTAPDGYTGASVWGSNPVVWKAGGALLVGTGNNASIPAVASQCLVAAAGLTTDVQLACLDPTDYVDSLLSLDLKTGTLLWSRRFEVDTWTSGCSVGPQSACPTPAGLDDDFASMPNLVYMKNLVGTTDDRGGTSKNYMLGAGQKSGYYRGINPYNGGLFWSTYIGAGQILWGSALNTDDSNAAYVALFNKGHFQNTLAGQKGVTVPWNAGAWASVSLVTGQINWQVPAYGADLATPQFGGAAPGPVTFTNRVLFAGSTSGYMVALDGNSGRRLWTFNAGGSIIGGPSVYNETVYWGAGATRSGPGSVHTMYAFSVPPPS